jgi:hypothetical protein
MPSIPGTIKHCSMHPMCGRCHCFMLTTMSPLDSMSKAELELFASSMRRHTRHYGQLHTMSRQLPAQQNKSGPLFLPRNNLGRYTRRPLHHTQRMYHPLRKRPRVLSVENISRCDPNLGTAHASHVPLGSFRNPADTQCSFVISPLAGLTFCVDVVYSL